MRQDVLRTYRATGRTHRMLVEAVSLVRKGKCVTIVAASDKHIIQMVGQIKPLFGEDSYQCRWNPCTILVGEGKIAFVIRSCDRKFEYGAMHIQGTSNDDPIFIDHSTLEIDFGHIFRDWLKYTHGPENRR